MSLRFRFTKNQAFTDKHGAIVVDACGECETSTAQEVAGEVYHRNALARVTWKSADALAESCDSYEQEFGYEGGGYTCILCSGEVTA